MLSVVENLDSIIFISSFTSNLKQMHIFGQLLFRIWIFYSNLVLEVVTCLTDPTVSCNVVVVMSRDSGCGSPNLIGHDGSTLYRSLCGLP